jgi:ElaB/YqjD/DUF883 family membrane-anchored ribosome-binding protein
MMATRDTSSDSRIPERTAAFGQDVANRASEAGTAISEAARTATKKVDEGRSIAADRLEAAASSVHERAAELPGGEGVREFAHATADRLSTTADYIRDHDTKRMIEEVEVAVKNNPGPALLVAAAFGFVLGVALTRH